ncbi:hypothetical protein GCM10028808_61060 [Spirosoma migulaei]
MPQDQLKFRLVQLYAICTAGLFFLLLVGILQLFFDRSPLENVEEANIYPIISQSQKPHILQWIGLIVFTLFFLSFLGLSIADASWASFAITIVVYMIILIRMLISMFLKKIYYLSSDKIIVADQKNEYITELPINEIEKWNYYSDKKEDCLVVSGRYDSIIIEKDSYDNFEEILTFFYKCWFSKR